MKDVAGIDKITVKQYEGIDIMQLTKSTLVI